MSVNYETWISQADERRAVSEVPDHEQVENKYPWECDIWSNLMPTFPAQKKVILT